MMQSISVTVNQRVLLTRNYSHFEELHELVIDALGHHPGIFVIRKDNDPRRDLRVPAVATAISRFLASQLPVADEYIILNHWR